jgi:hypothetical protein
MKFISGRISHVKTIYLNGQHWEQSNKLQLQAPYFRAWIHDYRSIDDDDYHVDGVTLRIWNEAINEPIVHLPVDTRAWRSTVEWCREPKNDSSTTALWQSYQQSSGSK